MWSANTELLQAPHSIFCHRRSPWTSPSHPFGMCVPNQIPAREWDADALEKGKRNVLPGWPFKEKGKSIPAMISSLVKHLSLHLGFFWSPYSLKSHIQCAGHINLNNSSLGRL